MEFRILGPLEALDGGKPLSLGGRKRRAVLALLLLHPDETVGSERMVDELWGESAPPGTLKTLQVHISRLRKELPDVLVTRGHGYELQIEPDQLDAHRFERSLDEARSELAADRPEHALALLERGLALWRGPPLADLAYEPFAQAEIARLEDLRLAADEQLIEAKLALGRHSELIGPLERLVEEHPYRERLRGQLMLALYRADRQADALQAYQDARRTLVEELGIEPGERLRELEAAVLAQDPSLAFHEPEPVPEPPAGLPTGVVTFLLTDIEASVELWEADHDAMAAALELHDELVGRGVDAHAGRVLKAKGEGDSTLSVFPRASDAVGCAAELRESLATAAWPGGLDLRVRIALHTGEAQERGGDYYGPALNRAARLRALAAGGVTLLSQATTEIVHDRVPAGTELVDLGSHELRGLARPERVFELRAQGAAGATGLPAPAQEIRKTVTVAFVCLSEAGAAGEELDAEARRRVSSHALASARTILERHGASVADYPGEVLMAVFGVPLLHEDDAVRAVRSGLELRQTLPGVTAQFAPALEVELAAQVGIATGEVIAGGTPGLASGPAVTTAKRLEELAAPGDIVVDTVDREARARIGVDRARALRGRRRAGGLRGRGASPPRDAPARPRVAARGTRPAAGGALGRVRGGGEHSHLPPRDRARRGGRGEVAPRGRVHARARRRGDGAPRSLPRHTERASPTGRSASWSATWRATPAATPRRRCAARSRPSWRTIPRPSRSPRRSRTRSGSANRAEPARRRSSGRRGGSSRCSRSAGPWSSCSTTSSGRRRPSSTSWSTWRTWRATRRSCCSAWRGQSCSTAVRAGAEES